jgi:hypothetical protein
MKPQRSPQQLDQHRQTTGATRELMMDAALAAAGLLIWAGFAALILSHIWA